VKQVTCDAQVLIILLITSILVFSFLTSMEIAIAYPNGWVTPFSRFPRARGFHIRCSTELDRERIPALLGNRDGSFDSFHDLLSVWMMV